MDLSLSRLTSKKSALHRVLNRSSGVRFSYICISDSIRKYVSSISTLASFGMPLCFHRGRYLLRLRFYCSLEIRVVSPRHVIVRHFLVKGSVGVVDASSFIETVVAQ